MGCEYRRFLVARLFRGTLRNAFNELLRNAAGNQQVLYTDSIFLSFEVERFDQPGEGLFHLRNPARPELGDHIPMPRLRQRHDRKMHEMQRPEREIQVYRVWLLGPMR